MSRNSKFHNPVEEGIVYKAEQYEYGSTIDYAGEKGLLDIVLIRLLPHDTIVRQLAFPLSEFENSTRTTLIQSDTYINVGIMSG